MIFYGDNRLILFVNLNVVEIKVSELSLTEYDYTMIYMYSIISIVFL